MSLDVDITLRLGSLDLRVALEVEDGEVVALLGPNGAGKSTVLRCIAGLAPVDTGRIRIDREPVDDPAAGVFVPAERRSIGVVFQDYLLFAHMTALENVAFGLRARGTNRHAARAVAERWLERVGLDGHARHRPATLSGGQAQRVALARALATNPRVLLLDEPLAALDAGSRSTVRRDLRRHLESFRGMRLLVTHDPVDAHALADRVVILEGGCVVQRGTLAEVTAHPRSRYVAELAGVNLIRGNLTGQRLIAGSGAAILTAGETEDGPAFAAIRPQSLVLHRHHPESSARNVWQLGVTDVDVWHDRARVALDGELSLVAEITTGALTELDLRLGDRVWASAKASDITTYAA